MELNNIISSGLLELYVTGLATDVEVQQVEQWAREFPEVKNEIAALQDVMESYAMAEAIAPDENLREKILDKIQPDDSVKEKIFSRIQTAPKQEPFSVIKNSDDNNNGAVIYKIPSYYKWAIAASVILLLGSLFANYTFYNKYKSSSNDLQLAQNNLQRQQQIAADMNKDIDVIKAKDAIPVVLNGTPHAPEALAKIFWMKNTGDVYVDPTNLPETPAGKQYQLWAIVDGKPVDGGMIITSKGTFHIQKMKTFGKAQAFAITMEKFGGSPTPSMDQMVVKAVI